MTDPTKELCELLERAYCPMLALHGHVNHHASYCEWCQETKATVARLRSNGPDGLRVVPKSLNYSSIHDIASDLWKYLRNFLKHDAPEDQLFYEIERAMLRAGGEHD